VGFAAGIERLLMVLEKTSQAEPVDADPTLFIVALDAPSRQWAFVRTLELRRRGIRTEIDYLARSIKAQMREANRQQASYVLVVGEQELRARTANLKNMKSGDETPVSLDTLELPIAR
jgi:histidyl-tRNA synthetase